MFQRENQSSVSKFTLDKLQDRLTGITSHGILNGGLGAIMA